MDNLLKEFKRNVTQVLEVCKFPQEKIAPYVDNASLLMVKQSFLNTADENPNKISQKEKETMDTQKNIADIFVQVEKLAITEQYKDSLQQEAHRFLEHFAQRLALKTTPENKARIEKILSSF